MNDLSLEQIKHINPVISCFHDKIKEYDSKNEPVNIYFLFKDDEIVYIGQTTNLKSRLSSHRRSKSFDRTFFFTLDDGDDAGQVESALIRSIKPKLNETLKGKLTDEDYAILEKYGAKHLPKIAEFGIKSFRIVDLQHGAYGPVQVIDGYFAGRFGYYDDDEIELEFECDFCEKAKENEISLPDDFECEDCIWADYAIVYLGEFSEGYQLIPHECLRHVDEDIESDKAMEIVTTFFPWLSSEQKQKILETGDPLVPLRELGRLPSFGVSPYSPDEKSTSQQNLEN